MILKYTEKIRSVITALLILCTFLLGQIILLPGASAKVVNQEAPGVQGVAAGYGHSVFLRGDGTVWACGENAAGQLGNGKADKSNLPVRVKGLTGVKAIAAGNNHSLALKADGTVWAWGKNSASQLGDGTAENKKQSVQVIGLTEVKEIAAGGEHSLALKNDGTVWAWGSNATGQLGDATNENQIQPVQVTGLTNVKAIGGGGSHSLALEEDGTVWAWGSNSAGQLGDETTENKNEPVQVTGLTNVKAIAAGGCHSLAVKEDGTVWAWGDNSGRQLGSRSPTTSNTPLNVGNLTAVAVSAGVKTSFVLKEDGTVWAWGYGRNGVHGTGQAGGKNENPAQVKHVQGIKTVSIGCSHGLAVGQDGTFWSWGWNKFGQLGDGKTNKEQWKRLTPASIPVGVAPALTVDTTDNIANQPVELTFTDYLDWRENITGMTVNGTFIDDCKYEVIASKITITGDVFPAPGDYDIVIQAGDYTDAAITQPIRLSCPTLSADMDNNLIGQPMELIFTDDAGWRAALDEIIINEASIESSNYDASAGKITIAAGVFPGAGDYVITVKAEGYADAVILQTVKVIPVALSDVQIISASARHSLFVNDDGTVWAWGVNSNGQLGNGTTENKNVPVRVKELIDVKAVAVGSYHSLALKEDGTVWAWGKNNAGQLGDGTWEDKSQPVQVNGLAEVKSISAGNNHSLALKEDGTVWAWGGNGSCQLGNGTTDNSNVPVQVLERIGQSLTGVKWISAGNGYSLVVKNDGTIWAWGSNGNGRLGDGTKETRILPVQAQGLTDVLMVSAGHNHSVALKNNGTVWTWGKNNQSQLGFSGDRDRIIPAPVAGISDINYAVAGCQHSLTVKRDGTAWGCGQNVYGQLGDGTNSNAGPILVQVAVLSDTKTVVAGNGFSMAVKSDGTLWTWGRNNYGQLGDGTMVDRNTPGQILLKEEPPALNQDTDNNLVGQAVDLIFTDDTVWRTAITAISIDGNDLTEGEYTVSEGKITIEAGVFTEAGEYTVVVTAAGYWDASVTQAMKAVPTGTVTPAAPEEGQEYAPGDMVNISGTAQNMEYVTISVRDSEGELVYAAQPMVIGEQYTTSFNLAHAAAEGVYTIKTGGGNLDQPCTSSFEVREIVQAEPPTLVADSTDNTMRNPIELSFTDDISWRSAISKIAVNDRVLSGDQYSITEGKIIIDASIFTVADSYTIVIKADGYPDATLVQPIERSGEQIILTWTADPTTSQTITWLMPNNLPAGVQYVEENEYTGSFDTAQQIDATMAEFDSTNYRYTVNVTGLTPDTEYIYRVGREGEWSEPLSFTTAEDTDDFTFLYMGDIQDGYDEWGSMVDSVYQDYPETRFSLLGGDITDNGSDPIEWGQFLDAATGVFSQIPVMPTLGNHDGDMYDKFFALPDNGPGGLQQEFYSFDYGNVHFLILNSNANCDERAKQWMQQDLQATNKEWKFAVFHHPAYPVVTDYKGISKSICENWIPILEQYNVDMVFVGHQHEYMRTYPIYQGEVQTDPQDYGIVYVMGNAGTKYYAPGPGFDYIAKEVSGSNYQLIDIDDDVLTMTSIKADGEVIESYTIDKELNTEPNPAYTITPLADPVYTTGTTLDGINTMTVNTSMKGFKYFAVNIAPLISHSGKEAIVFTHLRNGSQIGLNSTKADFDIVQAAQAGFNVQPGDVVKAYIVDDLSNAVDFNPTILQ